MTIRIGTRSSKLALWQTSFVVERLRAESPELEVSVVRLSTHGDETPDRPLPEIGGKGLFTEKIEQALRAGEIDAAVHSLKDLPVDDAPGTVVGAVLGREEARDVVISRGGYTLSTLPAGAVVGTSSTRREAQLRAERPDLSVRPIRGNVETRIGRVEHGEYDATVMAGAGVSRLGISARVDEWLEIERFLPAPGQGALAVQCRSGDSAMLALIARIDDERLRRATDAEREFLRALGGGCAAPVAAFATHVGAAGRVSLVGRVISPDGKRIVKVRAAGDDPGALGRKLAEEALEAGAGEILAGARSRSEQPLPLAGRRVVITRPRAQASEILERLARQGAVGVPLPLIRIEPVHGDMRGLPSSDWILFTSVNGVEHFFSRVGETALSARIGAVGPATAEALRSRGLAPAFQPEEQTGAALARGIAALEGSSISSRRILIPCAAEAGESTAEILREAGASVEEMPVYRTVPEEPAAEELARISKGVDAVVFMSGSAARAFRALVESTPSLAPAFEKAVVACIGPTTAESARAAGLRVDIVPGEHSSEGLVAALADHFSAKAGR